MKYKEKGSYAPENWKVMTVPFVAVTLLGMYWKIPPCVEASAPTWIVYRMHRVSYMEWICRCALPNNLPFEQKQPKLRQEPLIQQQISF
jgi:hypothetical protein